MTYTFAERVFKQGTRYFIKIPFNVWNECGQKGLIPVTVSIENHTFECRLVPKGEGIYYIPITKNIVTQINCDDELNISFQIINELTRINHNSPYSKENPIRKIDNIQSVTYPKAGYCGQICIAMLTGLSVDEIVDIMQAKAWQCSFSKLLETLDYFGISHSGKITYTKRKEFTFPECCIVNVKDGQFSHFALYYKENYYDKIDIDYDNIIGFLEIIVE